MIQTYKGDVLQFDYIATKRDVKLCPSYYESPRSFVQVLIEGCCPSLAITCPQNKPQAGETIKFSASYADDDAELEWEVTGGKIVSGQGTCEITVDTSGLGGRFITATVGMHFKGKPHTYNSSCSVEVRLHHRWTTPAQWAVGLIRQTCSQAPLVVLDSWPTA